MQELADLNVDELRRRARRRLVGAVVLALGVAVVVPMLLETEQKPLGDDVSVKIPPVDSGKFVNRLNDGVAKSEANAKNDDAKPATQPAPATGNASEPSRKYDTRVPDDANHPPSENAPAPAPIAPAPSPSAASISTQAESSPSQVAAPAPATDAAKVAHAADTAKSAHAPSLPAPHEGFAVQLAAFADDRGANSLAGRLKRAGYAAYTEPLKTSKGTLWRVRVGPYSSREAAQAARDKLRNEGQSGIVAPVK